MPTQTHIDNMYISNMETVRKIGDNFGFKLHSCNPDWGLYYESGEEVKEVADKFMECVAKTLGLPWVNVYNSSLLTVVLDKASMQMEQEDQAYRIASIVSILIYGVNNS